MAQEKNRAILVKCEACGKEVSRTEIRHFSFRRCCSVIQVPLCPECFCVSRKKMTDLPASDDFILVKEDKKNRNIQSFYFFLLTTTY